MVERGLRFRASDGKELAYLRSSPEGKPRAVLVVGHGMNDHSSRFLKLAGVLNPLGLELWIPDLRGHGATDPGADRGFLADSDGFDRVVRDLVELGAYAVEESGGLPLYYFGHSFGALLGMALIAQHGTKLAGAVLSAPPEKPAPLLDFGGRIVIGLGMLFKGPHAPARLPRSMTFGAYAKTVPDAHTGSDWISRDAQAVAAYEADPECNFTCGYGFYRDLTAGLRKVYGPGFLEGIPASLPLYLFAGSADPVIGMREGFDALQARFRGLRIEDFEARCYEGGRHESINETNAPEVLADIASWFARRLA
ncbi:MAG: alpha/beta hydrolase [Rectinemataceae bacterium]